LPYRTGRVALKCRLEIASLAARYRLPAVYPYRFFTEVGGLLSYGGDVTDNYRRAASYVERILNGEKPGELPVQALSIVVL
jgi:putative ABC transport system substrate-binding protein